MTLPGAAPGTIVADPEAPPPVIRVIAYGPDDLVEETIGDPRVLADFMNKWPITWVNVDGLGDAEVIRTIGEVFNLHPLALEDVASANQRPKLEEYDESVFVIARMPRLDRDTFRNEQVSLFLGRGYVVTFQEQPGGCFELVRMRLHETPRSRFLSADYLAYALLDAIIDSYFPMLEALGERLAHLEEEIARSPRAGIVGQILEIRRGLLALRRGIWPARDMLNSLVRDPIALVSDTTRTYLRDCYDHTVRIVDLVETYRELNAGLMEFYQSSVGYRMNEIMKVLTVIATIFIPLTFIAGVYGMNFNSDASPWSMPELNWYWGYPFVLMLMAVIVGLSQEVCKRVHQATAFRCVLAMS
jgi:magnesium transporter